MKRLICLVAALIVLFSAGANASKIEETRYFKCALNGERYQSIVKFRGYKVSSKTFFVTQMTYLVKGGSRIGNKNNIKVGSQSNSDLYFNSGDNIQAGRLTGTPVGASFPRGKTLFLTTVFDFYFARDPECVTKFRL